MALELRPELTDSTTKATAGVTITSKLGEADRPPGTLAGAVALAAPVSITVLLDTEAAPAPMPADGQLGHRPVVGPARWLTALSAVLDGFDWLEGVTQQGMGTGV